MFNKFSLLIKVDLILSNYYYSTSYVSYFLFQLLFYYCSLQKFIHKCLYNCHYPSSFFTD